MLDEGYNQIQCRQCRTQLFVTSGRSTADYDAHIEVGIQCPRCGAMWVIRLTSPGYIREMCFSPARPVARHPEAK